MPHDPNKPAPTLLRALGALDTALITIGATLGSAVFITTGNMARALPHAGLILALWAVGGLLALAGALTYAELGAMFPRAGGQYHYLTEAYGPLPGFLFGWASFLVIQTGGIATLGAAFGEYLGVFLPFFATRHAIVSVHVGESLWVVNGGQLAGALAIALLSAVNYFGLKHGARLQSVVTLAKVGVLVVIAGVGSVAPLAFVPSAPPPRSPSLAAGFAVAMIAVFWSYDGWYSATFNAGEIRRPERNLPLGLVLGTCTLTALYVVVNAAYLRILPMGAVAASQRVAEDAARAIFGTTGALLISAAVLVSIFGCISSSILSASRIYLPMAEDGLFFSPLARIHPRYRTPAACIVAQGAWSVILVFSGSYEQLFTYVVAGGLLFHVATGAAVFVLRRKLPDAPRPYRVWGYPWIPIVFIASSMVAVVSTLAERPKESALGFGLILIGLPGYAYWRRRRVTGGSAARSSAPETS